MKVAALIPARKGSKRIPDKNFRIFCGKPLWHWTLEAAEQSGIFNKIILSSDGGFGKKKREDGGLILFDNDRPEEFSNDSATMEQLLTHYANEYPDVDIWAILQPTSPLREAQDISGAYKMLIEDERDSIVSVFKDPLLFWVRDAVEIMGQQCPVASFHIDKRPNSQDRVDWLKENGAVYFTPAYTLRSTGSRCGGRVGLYEMPKERSIEIDDEYDWDVAEYLMSKRLGQKAAA